jgi:predicted nucleic acid-binding protein
MPAEGSTVVVNTWPLIALAACGQIDLLRSLHSRVIVPVPVVAELERGRLAAGAMTVDLPKWIEVVSPQAAPSPFLRAILDDGEASVISLATEVNCQLVLIDERRGRMVARLAGLEVAGTVGVLLRAKRLGILNEIKPSLEIMRDRGIWLSNRLVEFALHEANES